MLSGHETRTPGLVLGDGSSLDHPRKQPSVDCYKNRTPGFVWVMAVHSTTRPGNNILSGRLGLRAWFWVTAAHSITPGNTMLSGHETRTPGFVLGVATHSITPGTFFL